MGDSKSYARPLPAAALVVRRSFLVVVDMQMPAAPRRLLIAVLAIMGDSESHHRPLPTVALIVRRRYFIVAPMPMPAAPKKYLIVVPRP
jgi:hypothetical protein